MFVPSVALLTVRLEKWRYRSSRRPQFVVLRARIHRAECEPRNKRDARPEQAGIWASEHGGNVSGRRGNYSKFRGTIHPARRSVLDRLGLRSPVGLEGRRIQLLKSTPVRRPERSFDFFVGPRKVIKNEFLHVISPRFAVGFALEQRYEAGGIILGLTLVSCETLYGDGL